jgi:hypothetical protein
MDKQGKTPEKESFKVSLAQIPLIFTKHEDGSVTGSIEPEYLAQHPEAPDVLQQSLLRSHEIYKVIKAMFDEGG